MNETIIRTLALAVGCMLIIFKDIFARHNAAIQKLFFRIDLSENEISASKRAGYTARVAV